jgi:hypothetical protein
MNLWYSTLGLYQPKQHKYHTTIQKQSTLWYRGCPRYIRNDNLHKDLDVATVDSVIKEYAQRHEQRLHRHINVEALQLLHNDDLTR